MTGRNQPFRMTKGKVGQVQRTSGRTELDRFKEQKTASTAGVRRESGVRAWLLRVLEAWVGPWGGIASVKGSNWRAHKQWRSNIVWPNILGRLLSAAVWTANWRERERKLKYYKIGGNRRKFYVLTILPYVTSELTTRSRFVGCERFFS